MTEPKPPGQLWIPNPDPTSIVIPGVDATASTNDQIDQIDQLITIRLQNIDANFSRIQHLIATKLLPAFKRYAEGTEPVREAAKFWKSFYEAAAQIRIPIATDTSSIYRMEEDSAERDTTRESEQDQDSEQDPDRTPANIHPQDDSFVRGAAVSSTPLVREPNNVSLPRDDDADESWTASIESPFERLGRQVKDLTLEEARQLPDDPSTSDAPSFSPLHGTYTGAIPRHQDVQSAHRNLESSVDPTPKLPRSRSKGKTPLRQNVLRQNAALAAASEGTSTPPRSLYTPRRSKTPKNPFLPPNSASRQWNGLVDLRQPSPAKSKSSRAPRTPEPPGGDGYDSDSSDDLFPPGMSPPVTMQFAMSSRVRASPAKLSLTPARKAAERIGHDFVATAASKGTGTSSSRRLLSPAKKGGEPSFSSVASSLPSLTRYSGRPAQARALAETPASIEPPPSQEEFVTPAHQIYRHRLGPEAYTQAAVVTPEQPYSIPDLRQQLATIVPSPGSSDSDRSEEHDESNPSAGFLFATQNNARAVADDSFASSQSSEGDEDESDAARAARHPLAHIFGAGEGAGAGPEDSFDHDESFARGGEGEEETVFGARQVRQGAAGEEGRVHMMRDALIDDTHPGAVSLNPFAQVEQSPTPYVRDAEELG